MANDIAGTTNDVTGKDGSVQAEVSSTSGSTGSTNSGRSPETSEKSRQSYNSKACHSISDSSLHEAKNHSSNTTRGVWYRESRSLGLGDVNRYTIKYTSAGDGSNQRAFYFRLKNMEKTGLRAIHLVNGPFILYCHIVPWNYNPNKKFEPYNEQKNNEVCFKNTIKPGQTFNVKMEMNSNSLVQENPDGTSTYGWHCDVISQVVLNRRASISYTLMVGDNLREMRRANRSALTALSKGDFMQVFESEATKARDRKQGDDSGPEADENSEDKKGLDAAGLSVECKTTQQIWTRQPQYPGKPIHLVIITHGIFSNLTADMLFLRDAIMSLNSSSQNYLVDGFRGNAGKTEKGIHRLGAGVAVYTVKLIDQLEKKGHQIRDISFVGHSLGGPVQLYALKHILETEKADYFERKNITLKHFVCMASPMLGILSEMSLLISWFLDLGTLGKTGRDLTLSKKLPVIRKDPHKHGPHWEFHSARPLLETLPDEPVATLLKNFHSRTVYANAINDGIVPLRTSALLYLDWEALGNIRGLKNESAIEEHEEESSELAELSEIEGSEGDRTSAFKDRSTNSSKGDRTSDASKDRSTETSKGDRSTNTSKGDRSTNTSKGDNSTDTSKADSSTESDQNSKVESEDGKRIGQVPEESNMNVAEKYTTFLARIFNLDFDNSSKKQPLHKRKKMRNRIKRYAKITVKSSDLHTSRSVQEDSQSQEDGSDEAELGEVSGDEKNDAGSFNIPPKASAVESALNSMICPIPSRDYINNPSSRSSVIFHDRYYHFKHVPKEKPKTGNFKKLFRYHDWRMDKQVKIAAKYHGPKLSWRKVLVKLPPDAHNNIVVRRRFANGYGWGVVEHLKNQVFAEDLKAKF